MDGGTCSYQYCGGTICLEGGGVQGWLGRYRCWNQTYSFAQTIDFATSNVARLCKCTYSPYLVFPNFLMQKNMVHYIFGYIEIWKKKR